MEPSANVAVPTVPGVSMSVVSASVNPLSRATAVDTPVSAGMVATGVGAPVAEAAAAALVADDGLDWSDEQAETPTATAASAAPLSMIFLENMSVSTSRSVDVLIPCSSRGAPPVSLPDRFGPAELC